MPSRTTAEQMAAIAVRMQVAIKAGNMKAEHGSDVTIDIGSGERVNIFNDAGTADYTMSMALATGNLEYGTDFGLSGNEDFDRPETYTFPPDPLDLIDEEATAIIEQACHNAW
ncbi:hypothetical protein LPB73_07690 [Tardiphaga sp. 37S4]|uniref:hypothetical protein n=1 Tax=Tardiphaga sp. 37S4 TaxID=1404741 RepID=UPI001E3D77A2|nr:hypothetical protein [Tardiphaga sp. 37S4]UFS77250.1 hypothetical protein LPB73_07690 [Tardiphaga sp. 37S4]